MNSTRGSVLTKHSQTLNHHQIYSAPVYNEESKEYVGMIDMLDMVEFISQNFDEAQLLGEGFEAIFEQAERFGSTPIHDVVGTFHFVILRDDPKLTFLSCRPFSTGLHGESSWRC